jgi:hypothetical protein
VWGRVYGFGLIIHVRATLDEGAKPKSGKPRLNLPGTILEGKSIGLNPKKKLKRRVHHLHNQAQGFQPKPIRWSNSRIQSMMKHYQS